MERKRELYPFEGLIHYGKMCYQVDKTYIIFLILQQFYKAVISISFVMIPQHIIDCTFYENDLKKTLEIVCAFCSILLFFYLLGAHAKKVITKHRMLIYRDFELKISSMMMQAEYEKIEDEKFLNIKARAEKYLFSDGKGFGFVLENSFELLSNIVTICFMGGVIISLNPIIILILLIILGINTYINMIMQRRTIEINREKVQYERLSRYYSIVSQDFRYGKDIRSYNASAWFLDKYKKQLDAMQGFYEKIACNSFVYEAGISITAIIQQTVSYAYVILYGIKKMITVGQFSMYLSSITSFSTTIKDIANNIVSMQQYTQYYKDYLEYLEYQNKEEGTRKLDCNNGKIEFRNVSFKYQGQSKFAVKNINLEINLGDKILFVGENGAGKTTLIKLLLRFYKPTEGEILFNGINIQEYSNEEYARLFATVFQDYKLFTCSIKENIAMNKIIDEERLLTALNAVGVYEKVINLRKGIDTTVYKDFDQNGYVPSGGESQKIAICRAIYKDAQIIVLDEPNAAMDPKAEAELYSMLEQKFEKKTIIYISHRLSGAHLCNRVVSLKNGEIVEDSTHEQLLNEHGIYGDLYRMQAEKYAI